MAHHVFIAVACVNGRLEYFHFLMCEDGTFHSADQLFCLAREHRPAHHLNSSWAAHFSH